jgi:hypothetical protein
MTSEATCGLPKGGAAMTVLPAGTAVRREGLSAG